ncbi:glycosyltransferase [Actinokineospora inagensis]|uniref:glycosyltransferase n=1 Tax=Actinokineospora inagensis TaxID=103730 RepID=UPI000427D22D|nr:glycosyltransferase [Actinokineospora inagensis]
MTAVLCAVALAALAACCFAAAVHLQHRGVRALGVRLGALLRAPDWLLGGVLALTGTGLHVLSLSLAPLSVVQPVGVIGLAVTALVTGRGRIAATVVCVGTAGFVVTVATAANPIASAPDLALVQGGVVLVAAMALVGWCFEGRARCLVLACAAAVAYGLGSALVKAALASGSPFPAVESAALIGIGAWLAHQAYASGRAAVVIGALTVLDPLTAVAVGAGVYGEIGAVSPLQLVCAAVAIVGVVLLARDQDAKVRAHRGEPRTVLIAADTFPPDVNGAANFADRLARGLAGRGLDVHVVCPSPDGRPGTSVVAGVTVHRISSWRTPFHPTFRICLPWRASREVAPLLDRLDPDVVHVQAHFGVGRTTLGAATRRGVPVVATNHFMPENLFGYSPIPRFLHRGLARLAYLDLRRIFGRASVITAPTPTAAALLHHRGLTARAISCGIDLSRFAGSSSERGRGPLIVAFVGRLDAEKNIDVLLRALPHVPEVRAELVGIGTCRESLADLAVELGVADRVVFHGFRSDEDLVGVLHRVDAFVMPGTAELQSIATMEAMAAGLPVLAADAVALPHLVRPGETGFLFPPGDHIMLAAALAELADNPARRRTLGAAGRALITRHDLATTLDEFQAVYRGLVQSAVTPTVHLAPGGRR